MVSRDLRGPVREAILERLRATPEIVAIVGERIFDYVPDEPGYPLIRVETSSSVPFEATGISGSEISTQVSSFVKGYGPQASEELDRLIVETLDEAPLALSNGYLIDLVHEQTLVLEDQDERGVYQGVHQFTATAGAA